jgi:hypothetical protein
LTLIEDEAGIAIRFHPFVGPVANGD